MDYVIKEVSLDKVYKLRHEVMWPNKEIDFIKLSNDHEGIHLGLFIKNDLISVISLFINNNEAQFRKFATKVTDQNKGYGSILLNYSFEYLKECGVERVFCNARSDKTLFYKRFLMKSTKKTFVKSNQKYVIMEKNL